MCGMCECSVCGSIPHEENDYCDGDKIVGYYDEELDDWVRFQTVDDFLVELNGKESLDNPE